MNPKQLDLSVVQISFFLPDEQTGAIKEWCEARLGVRARYPHGRWTYFPHYRIGKIPAFRVVLYYTEDQTAFALAWNGVILKQTID
jgi:hypothetical protein